MVRVLSRVSASRARLACCGGRGGEVSVRLYPIPPLKITPVTECFWMSLWSQKYPLIHSTAGSADSFPRSGAHAPAWDGVMRSPVSPKDEHKPLNANCCCKRRKFQADFPPLGQTGILAVKSDVLDMKSGGRLVRAPT